MINNKRLEKIRKSLEKKEGKDIVVKFEDDTEIKIKSTQILGSLLNVLDNKEDEFAEAIKGKKIVSCSGSQLLISITQQMIDHEYKELE